MSPQVLKVHLSARPEVYGRASAELTRDKVNKNLLLDPSGRHLYITRERRVRLTHTAAPRPSSSPLSPPSPFSVLLCRANLKE